MRKWIYNGINKISYLENKDNYISLNVAIDETALRLKVDTDYETFIAMGNHKNLINSLESDLDILNWFLKNTNGFWSNDTKTLEEYINDNFINKEN